MEQEKWVTVIFGKGKYKTIRRSRESNLHNVRKIVEEQTALMRRAGCSEEEIEECMSLTIVRDEE